MRQQNGMRPQDVAILLKICALAQQPWQMAGLANSLRISISEVSESLNRSQLAQLIDFSKKRVNRQNLLDFLSHGFSYVFPVQPGALVRGIATAHSHPFMKTQFASEMNYVWPDVNGNIIGSQIDPLYPKQVEAVVEDATYYQLLALADVLRVGKVREVKYAMEELNKIILNEPAHQYHPD
jgi:hypothetical protein